MKLHLHQLLSAVLLASLVATPAYAAEIPSGYEIIDFRIPEILSNYANNTEADYYAFKLYVDVACTPSTSPEWSETSPLVSGGNLIFTSADADNTASLIFSYGDSPAFNNVNSLKFDTFTHLKFTGIDTPIYDGSVEYVHDGGAINLADNGSLVISGVNDGVEGTSDVVFCGTLCIYGGVISAENITMNGNGDICCSENVGTFSGIIDAGFGCVTMNNNNSIRFSENSPGNCIYTTSLTMNENSSISFIRNPTDNGSVLNSMIVSINNNDCVVFSENKPTYGSYGDMIYGGSITMKNNGSITFSDNSPLHVVAMYTTGFGNVDGSVVMSDNGSVIFSGNTGSPDYCPGGAIYGRFLFLRNNDYVLFEKNAEIMDGVYRLRSVCIDNYSSTISEFSAAAGKKIEFRDSVYVGGVLLLNADYTDEEGVVHKQQGDIILTGATTEADLLEVKGSSGTAEEILASRTSKVAKTEIYGGRLRVEDGAVYQGQGITVHEASEATVRVKDAELSHAGYNLEFNAGTALEVAGNSTILGNVNLKEGSLFKLEQAASLSLHETVEADAATLTVNGGALLEGSATLNASLTLADGATLDMDALDAGAVTLNGALTFGGQVTMGDKLLGILSEMGGWEESVTLFTGLTNLVLPAVAADDAADRLWVGDVFSNLAGNENYYFNYVPEVGSLSVVFIPEPTTATLSLLALAALAARRRRK